MGDPQAFLTRCWGRRAHLAAEAAVGSPLTLADVDHLIASTALRLPAFRLVRGGATIDPTEYTRSARVGSRPISDLVDVAKVHRLHAQGATIVLQGLHRYWPPVARLCRQLEIELTHPVQANAYLTPPGSQGFNVHADVHEVFAVQTHGRKQWVVYAASDPDGQRRPELDVTLSGGDCLYVPRGMPHAARTVDEASLHLTIGVRVVTWADLARRATTQALDDGALAAALPPGWAHEPASAAAQLRALLTAATDRLLAMEAAGVLQDEAWSFWSTRPPLLEGQLAHLTHPPMIDDRTVVARRPGTVAALAVRDGRVLLNLGDRVLRMPARLEAPVRHILSAGRLTVGDLAPWLDEAGRRTLAARLAREGLLLIPEPSSGERPSEAPAE